MRPHHRQLFASPPINPCRSAEVASVGRLRRWLGCRQTSKSPPRAAVRPGEYDRNQIQSCKEVCRGPAEATEAVAALSDSWSPCRTRLSRSVLASTRVKSHPQLAIRGSSRQHTTTTNVTGTASSCLSSKRGYEAPAPSSEYAAAGSGDSATECPCAGLGEARCALWTPDMMGKGIASAWAPRRLPAEGESGAFVVVGDVATQ